MAHMDDANPPGDESIEMKRRRYPPPPPTTPRHVLDVPTVIGQRLILMTPNGPLRDYRAASEVIIDDSGSWIRVVAEHRWYAWLETPEDTRPPSCPRAKAWSTTNVWVE
jgi:hypothetical protein